MEIIKIHQHQGSDSTASLLQITDDKKSMDHHDRDRTVQYSSFFRRFWDPSPNSIISPRFIALCFLVFIYYIGYGYLQELMFTLDGFENTAWFLTCYQFLVYAFLSFIHLGIAGLDQRRTSYASYILLALLTVMTMGLSNYAVAYLNYPTQVMFKCCKLIPVLIGGILIQKKSFNRYDVAAAFSMSIGLIFFTLADSKVQPNFNLYGVIIICSALVADAAIGNYQEKIMREHHVSNVEIVFYSFMFGFGFVLFGLLVTNNFFANFEFWNQHPVQTYGYGLIFSIFGYLGIDIVLTLIKEYGALICVTVTTCRKSITIVLSFTLFSKPFVFDYVWSGLIVIFGIYLNVYSRHQTAFNTKIVSIANILFNSRWWPRILAPVTSRTLSI
ncbi:unnamed protein product [Rotaria magnacalcarata]|uniref:Adenosine 3'-phospho 5'-phosphosulfate transporter 2 n=1 Tax=Rotaria magnacalcarata TaxID=392030 RepID=A0A815LW14_9BILA|nr:unnamed protein product [Rotaria magnacalcarata]CAF1668607.1 unnamed protein product [Rotaria magnacalcarata]CAF2266197.1 unnamed protein product [Rotaria magnacalcarata]CAF3884281.1 unnamed protein product [Rotaria magnacalcarata]